jgi:hypothetical protein
MMSTNGGTLVASEIGGGMARIWSNPIPTAARCLIWSVVLAGLAGAFHSASAPISTLLGWLSTVAGISFVVLVIRRLWIFIRDRGRAAAPAGQPSTNAPSGPDE